MNLLHILLVNECVNFPYKLYLRVFAVGFDNRKLVYITIEVQAIWKGG